MVAVMTGRVAAPLNGREIVGAGTSEATWQAWPELASLATCTLDDLLPASARLVVVAPHPDDEVLACGGLLAMAAQRGRSIQTVSVTDGDASHPRSALWPSARLAKQRHAESLEGLRRLGCAAPPLRLRLPDGEVAAHRAELTSSLRATLQPIDRVMTTWQADGHPDHEATAAAVQVACDAVGCALFQVPVWMWHWASPADAQVPWSRLRRLPLSAEAARRKVDAIEAHHSQLVPQDTGAPPVLPTGALQRLLRPFEYFMWPAENDDASGR